MSFIVVLKLRLYLILKDTYYLFDIIIFINNILILLSFSKYTILARVWVKNNSKYIINVALIRSSLVQ